MIKSGIAGVAIAASALLGLAACGSSRVSDGSADNGTFTDVGENGADGRMQNIDGVDCIVVTGYDNSSISCNWEAYNSKPTP